MSARRWEPSYVCFPEEFHTVIHTLTMPVPSRYANARVLYLHLGTYLSPDCLLCNSCSLKGSRKATYLQFIQLLSCHKSGSRALSSILPTWAEILSPSCLLKLKPTKKHSLSHSLSFSDHLIRLTSEKFILLIFLILQTFTHSLSGSSHDSKSYPNI